MTGVDKILVIVVLVFSVVFVVAAISGYTSTHKKIDGYEKQVTDAKAIAQKNSAEAANWKGMYDDLKASDDFLDPLFRAFFKKLSLPLALRKSDYHTLARLMPKDKLDTEVREKLDLIATVASQATPCRD